MVREDGKLVNCNNSKEMEVVKKDYGKREMKLENGQRGWQARKLQ